MTPSARKAKWFEDRYVAFVDILGFREIVRQMQEDRKLFYAVRDALKAIDKQAQHFRDYRVESKQSHQGLLSKRKVPLRRPSQLHMTAFSDCYVISETLPAWHVVAAVQALGASLLGQGILCRGAIVKGAAYHRSRVLFGPAVIEAYELESQVAKYPRILVTEEVRKTVWGYHEGLWRGRLFLQDSDGCWFVNLLTPSMSKWKALSNAGLESSSRKFLNTVRKRINRELANAQGDVRHLSKLRWLRHHFNRVAKQKGIDLIE